MYKNKTIEKIIEKLKKEKLKFKKRIDYEEDTIKGAEIYDLDNTIIMDSGRKNKLRILLNSDVSKKSINKLFEILDGIDSNIEFTIHKRNDITKEKFLESNVYENLYKNSLNKFINILNDDKSENELILFFESKLLNYFYFDKYESVLKMLINDDLTKLNTLKETIKTFINNVENANDLDIEIGSSKYKYISYNKKQFTSEILSRDDFSKKHLNFYFDIIHILPLDKEYKNELKNFKLLPLESKDNFDKEYVNEYSLMTGITKRYIGSNIDDFKLKLLNNYVKTIKNLTKEKIDLSKTELPFFLIYRTKLKNILANNEAKQLVKYMNEILKTTPYIPLSFTGDFYFRNINGKITINKVSYGTNYGNVEIKTKDNKLYIISEMENNLSPIDEADEEKIFENLFLIYDKSLIFNNKLHGFMLNKIINKICKD